MREEKVVAEYAVGGATAVLFYAEPTRTYDVDVFVTRRDSEAPLVSLAPVYRWAEGQGFALEAEHLMVHGVPVQILPSYNALVAEAVIEARVEQYDDVPVRVAGPEHLVALALQAGGARLEDEVLIRKRQWHQAQARLPVREKVRILLQLQRQDLPLIARRRVLKAWERPWDISP